MMTCCKLKDKGANVVPSSSSGIFPVGPSLLFFSFLDWDVLKKCVSDIKQKFVRGVSEDYVF